MKCSIDQLADVIAQELADYSQEITDGIKQEVREVAKECRDEIKQNSPVLTGSYKKGWRTKVNYEGREDIRVTVHNKTDYQLTHLLENGWPTEGGTLRAYPIPHIGPAEQNAARKLENRVKVLIRK